MTPSPLHRYMKGETSLYKLVPNILTMMALCAGMTAIRFAFQGEWKSVIVALIVAGILDTLDGRAARLLKAQSKFGAELDSLSDVVSFGVAPALINYLWMAQHIGTLGWVACFIFAACAALRLARFNAKLGDSDMPPWAYQFFTGIPVPGGTALAVLPLILSFHIGDGWVVYPYVVSIWLIVVGGLMISRLPTFSFKGLRIPHQLIFPLLLGVGLCVAVLVHYPWLMMLGGGALYISTLPLAYGRFRHLEKREAKEAPSVPLSIAPLQDIHGDES